jgi:hypothetical protein
VRFGTSEIKIAKRQNNFKLAIPATAKLINSLGGQSAQQYRGRSSDAKILIWQLEQLD